MVPILGFLANFVMLGAVVWLGISAGGSTATDAVIAIAMVIVWLIAGAVWFMHNTKKEGRPIMTGHLSQVTGLDIDHE